MRFLLSAFGSLLIHEDENRLFQIKVAGTPCECLLIIKANDCIPEVILSWQGTFLFTIHRSLVEH